MNGNKAWLAGMSTAVLTCTSGLAWAQTSVSYGRITAVTMVAQSDQRAQTGGALVGGVIGATAGSGRSGSNRALGGIGGAFAGQQIGRLASQRQAFEYTVLLGGTQTITMVTDQAGKRVGDCVAVERGWLLIRSAIPRQRVRRRLHLHRLQRRRSPRKPTFSKPTRAYRPRSSSSPPRPRTRSTARRRRVRFCAATDRRGETPVTPVMVVTSR